MKFILKAGNVTVPADSTTLDDVMKEADGWITYCQSNLEIISDVNDDQTLAAYRTWYGCSDGVDECNDPIQFGDFGFYSDWIVVEF